LDQKRGGTSRPTKSRRELKVPPMALFRDLKKVEPLTILFKQRAKIKLIRSVRPVEPKENIKVRFKVGNR